MNKTIFTITVMLFLGAISLTAQTSLIIGVEGGVSLNKVKYTGDFAFSGQKYSRTFGYQGGIFAGVKFGGFSLLSGFHYKKLGGKSTVERNNPNNPWVFNDGTADIGIKTEVIKFSTLDIPILLRYEFGNNFKVTLSAGPIVNIGSGQFKTETSFNLTLNGELGPYESTYTFGNIGSDLIKKSFVSFYFSPGIMYKINENGLFRFNIGFESAGNIRNEDYVILTQNGVYEPSGSIKLNSIQFSIGYEHRINFRVGSKY